MQGGYNTKQSTMSGATLSRVMRPMPYPTPGIAGSLNKTRKKKLINKGYNMRWIKHKIKNWLFNDDDLESSTAVYVDRDANDINSENSIHFSVTNASGGQIIQVKKYDSRNDCNINSLHVVTPDEDLADALAQILTLERLSK